MSKTVLITRARGDEEALTEALHEYGLNVIHEPLTDIFLLHTARSELEQALNEDPDAILVTSRHGVRALATLTELRDLPLLCVGDATLDTALSLGFNRSCATGATVDDMIDYVRASYDEGSKLLYASADQVRADIGEALAADGIAVTRLVVYEAQPVSGLSDILVEHIKSRQLQAITFLSERAAKIFTKLAAQEELREKCKDIHACCMSETVAASLRSERWKRICIAEKPTLASLAKCVDNACDDRKN